MSNSTSYIDALTETFLAWFHNDILPVCSVIFDLAVIIVGVILNVLLMVTFRKRGLFQEPSSHFMVFFSIADFASYILLLFPNIVTAIAKEWLLSQPVCEIHGAVLFLLVSVNFGIVNILAIERCIKLCKQKGNLYDKIFERARNRNILICIVVVLSAVIAFLPVTGIGHIEYDYYHLGGKLDYSKTPSFLITHFLLTIIVSLVTVTVCYSLIFEHRRRTIQRNRKSESGRDGNVAFAEAKGNTSVRHSSTNESLAVITEVEDEVFREDDQSLVERSTDAKPTSKAPKKRSSIASSRRKSVFQEVFSDDAENPIFHLAITYLALWGTLFACFLPYMIICFIGVYDSVPLWGGFYTISLLVLHVSFALKPIVYLGHNRNYRALTTENIPESFRKRARSVRNSISSVGGKMEDFLFKSKANRQLSATVAAHKALLKWKGKAAVISLNHANGSPGSGESTEMMGRGMNKLQSKPITPSEVNIIKSPLSFDKQDARQRSGLPGMIEGEKL
ncbi:hypothetical protein DPMN_115259 [Dreissena polymorpha]|uniref:G-protein coupled receptors family 1 profile domain-containing protein n=1 Tax=Dreissena polymorpha TaxID=45954 RepID=A0A9D4KLM2_DREPO|nr:hypothetical protein DPMN_115259 [Dreissena polymorpha]